MQDGSQQDTAAQGSALVDWLHALFSRRAVRERIEGRPRRRGLAITTAILVSSLLWFTFTMRETHTSILEMPIEVVNLPEDQALTQLPPENVRVQILGDGWSIMRLRLRPPTIPISAQEQQVNVQGQIPEFPKNVGIQSVSPSTINLWKEQRVTRRLPVRHQVEFNTPATHDLLEDPVLIPDSVEVSGAASVVGDLQEWPTVQRTFDNVRDTLEARIALSDTLSGLVEKSVDTVMLRVISEQFTQGSREIEVSVQGQPATQTLVTLEPSTIHVKYRVLFSQYQAAEEAMDFFATVSYDEIRDDTSGRIVPHLRRPEGIDLRDVEFIPKTLGYYERIN